MRRLIALGALIAAIAIAVVTSASAASSPTVTTGTAASITDTSAAVSGTVNPQGVDTLYAFQYGLTSSYAAGETSLQDAGSGSTDVIETASLTGLTPGTTYHFRIVAVQPGGAASYGSDETFTATGTAPVTTPFAPAVSTGASSAITTSGATVAGNVTPNGLSTTYWFQFGTTSAYGYQTNATSAGASASAQGVSAALTGLSASTAYHYRVVAENADGTTAGPDQTFKTATLAPKVVTSTLKVLGTTGFVSPSHVAGSFIACVGGTSCLATVTIIHNGVTLGAHTFTLAPNTGGVPHITLNAQGIATMKQYPKGVSVNYKVASGGKTVINTYVSLHNFT